MGLIQRKWVKYLHTHARMRTPMWRRTLSIALPASHYIDTHSYPHLQWKKTNRARCVISIVFNWADWLQCRLPRNYRSTQKLTVRPKAPQPDQKVIMFSMNKNISTRNKDISLSYFTLFTLFSFYRILSNFVSRNFLLNITIHFIYKDLIAIRFKPLIIHSS